WDENTGAVTLMTVHAAKGLEFPVVFIVALEEGLLPHSRAKDDRAELEEERRLFFVGITRARRELYLSRCRMRSFRGQLQATQPSTFLTDPPEGPFAVGAFTAAGWPSSPHYSTKGPGPPFRGDPRPAGPAPESRGIPPPHLSGPRPRRAPPGAGAQPNTDDF